MDSCLQFLKISKFRLLSHWSVSFILETQFKYNSSYRLFRIGDFLHKSSTSINIHPDKIYKRVKVKINCNGVELRDIEFGKNIGTKKQNMVKSGQFIMSKIDARHGAFGIIPEELGDAIVTNDFPTFEIDKNIVNPEFFVRITSTKEFIQFAKNCSSGTTNRQRIDVDKFLNMQIPVPPITEQKKIINHYNNLKNSISIKEKEIHKLKNSINDLMVSKLGINKKSIAEKKGLLQMMKYSSIEAWELSDIDTIINLSSGKYALTSLNEHNTEFIARGKSPKYNENSNVVILNQKCNRINEIEAEFARKVDKKWFESIDKDILTKNNDLIINSTGEGTIGRASSISTRFEGYLYDSHILLVRPQEALINSYFLAELFNTSYIQEQVHALKSAKSTKQTELGINNLKKIKFPLPPLKEQVGIVSFIKSQKNKIHDLRVEITNINNDANSYINTIVFGKDRYEN